MKKLILLFIILTVSNIFAANVSYCPDLDKGQIEYNGIEYIGTTDLEWKSTPMRYATIKRFIYAQAADHFSNWEADRIFCSYVLDDGGEMQLHTISDYNDTYFTLTENWSWVSDWLAKCYIGAGTTIKDCTFIKE